MLVCQGIFQIQLRSQISWPQEREILFGGLDTTRWHTRDWTVHGESDSKCEWDRFNTRDSPLLTVRMEWAMWWGRQVAFSCWEQPLADSLQKMRTSVLKLQGSELCGNHVKCGRWPQAPDENTAQLRNLDFPWEDS